MPDTTLIMWTEMGIAEDILQKITPHAGRGDIMKVWARQQPGAADDATGPGALR